MTLSHHMTSLLKSLPEASLKNDSRLIQPGDIFLAYPGEQADGRDYIAKAIASGACAVIYEPSGATLSSNTHHAQIPLVPCEHLTQYLGQIAAYKYPVHSTDVNITGITGTNGKTTIAYQLAQAYQLLGRSSAYMGTLGAGPVNDLSPLQNTTPDALAVQQFLYAAVQQNISHIAMEVSSHGLVLHRVDEVPFSQAIYTNLSHDHLDFHKTMRAYAKAKAKLFQYESLYAIILNQDDAYTAVMLENATPKANQLTYGLKPSAHYYAKQIQLTTTGSQFVAQTPSGSINCEIQSLGLFNIYNTLAVIGSLASEGVGLSDINALLPQLKPSPGRMARVCTRPAVLIDYAHTPDALEKALSALQALKMGKLMVVFGCGGDRDTAKMAPMGEVAARLADIVVLTSDNPRTENPQEILKQIAAGTAAHATKQYIEPDRAKAIELALNLASANDVILIAGKGHENYQQIGHEKRPFSDEAVVQQLTNQIS